MQHVMRKPRKSKVIRYSDGLMDLIEYLAALLGLKESDKNGEMKL